MARISSDQIGLRDAADIFGVSIDTLRRRIRDNQLDEAVLVQGPFGATWVLPKSMLELIADREGWDQLGEPARAADVSRVSEPTHTPAQASGLVAHAQVLEKPSLEADIDLRTPVSAQDATENAVLVATTPPVEPIAHPVALPAASQVQDAAPPSPVVRTDGLVEEVTAAVAEEVARGLSDNVHAELSAVREAITAAEVRAVAADARTDALRSEKGRLEAQLKRAEADIEYWRSQHDRLDKDLDRERALRVTSDKAKSVAESETRVVRERVADLSVQVSDTQARERVLIATEASLQAELDQATMVMGWWSRRRLTKLQARSSGRTPPAPAGE